jgi:hypothetical protein
VPFGDRQYFTVGRVRQGDVMETTSAPTWLTRQQLADRLMVPFNTMNQWANKGYGPPYAIIGRHARYRLEDVIAWELEQLGGGGNAA